MKIYLDTADIEQIKKWVPSGLVDGVTTNPTHLAKLGGDPRMQVREICALLPHGLVSVQITESDPGVAYAQARMIAAIADNVLVKIPCELHYYPVIKQLVSEGININITLVFSLAQALFMAKIGVHTVSPFVGRLEDAGGDGTALLTDIVAVYDRHGFATEVLAASIRTPEQFSAALIAGVDAITLPINTLEQLVQHPLTDKGLQQFTTDWQTLGKPRFP